MAKNVAFGRFCPSNGVMYRTHALTKLLCTVLFAVCAFLFKSPVCVGISCAFTVAGVLLSGAPVKLYLRHLKSLLFYYLATFLILIVSDFSKEGVVAALLTLLRFGCMTVSYCMFTLTTPVSEMEQAMRMFFTPLTLFKVPVDDLACVGSIAIRFIPILYEEAREIIEAQKARGMRKGLKNKLAVIIPIFVAALRKSYRLSRAMKARGYGQSTKRTHLCHNGFGFCDVFVIVAVVGYAFTGGWLTYAR